MSAGAAAGSRFREVGGVTVYVEYHVARGVAYIGGTQGGEHGWVDRYGIVEERPHDQLH